MEAHGMESLMNALEFAAYRHRFDKTKNEEPYINHVIKVCTLLIVIGEVKDRDTIVAAALHDLLEKTSTKAGEISLLFGEPVLRIVLELTDANYSNEEEKWLRQVHEAPALSHEARVIKLADKIANVESIMTFMPEGWDYERKVIYMEWAEKIIHVLQGTNEKLENYFYQMCNEIKSRHLASA